MSLVRFNAAGSLPWFSVNDPEWAVVEAQSTHLIVQTHNPAMDTQAVVLHGDLSYGPRMALSGSVTSLTLFIEGVEVATVSDFNVDAGAFQPFIAYGSEMEITFAVLAGNDRLLGTRGTQHLWGFTGDDYLDGGAGVDVMYGGAGNDTYRVDNVNDEVEERDPWEIGDLGGKDKVIATVNYQIPSGVETLVLAGTARNATGDDGNDILQGNELANVLVGREGNDRLRGGEGDDILVGGHGADVLVGGAGADRFHFDFGYESGAPGLRDVIVDFARGEDRIDLRSLYAGGGHSSFRFIGTDSFPVDGSAEALVRVRYDAARDVLHVEASTDSDAQAEVVIALQGVRTLTAADFLL
jgi:Ca2+-binding RTX toxin-like protein